MIPKTHVLGTGGVWTVWHVFFPYTSSRLFSSIHQSEGAAFSSHLLLLSNLQKGMNIFTFYFVHFITMWVCLWVCLCVCLKKKFLMKFLFWLMYLLLTPVTCDGFPDSSVGKESACSAGAAAAVSLQSCPTLCDSIDGSPPGPRRPP